MKIMIPIALCIALLLSTSLYANTGNSREVGDSAADFLIVRLDGSTFRLSDYKGKKAVNLLFWATWCSSCKAEISVLNTLHERYGDDIEVLAVNVAVNDSLQRVKRYQKKYKPAYPLAFDEGREVSKTYRVVAVPTLIIIDINGVIRYRAVATPGDIGEHLDTLMGR